MLSKGILLLFLKTPEKPQGWCIWTQTRSLMSHCAFHRSWFVQL